MSALRSLANLLLPWSLLLLAAWAVQEEAVVRAAASPYAIYFCYASLVAALLLSWYQDQSCLLSIALAIGLAVWGWRTLAPAAQLARMAIVFLLPLNFVFFQVLAERGALSLSGLLRLAVIGVQIPLVAWLHFAQPVPIRSFLYWGEASSHAAGISLPLTEVICFAAVLFILLARALRRASKVEQALPWALAAAFLGFDQPASSDSLFFYAGAAGLILVVAVLEHGHDLATHDDLTGLPGRRAFNRALTRLRRRYAIAMCDVDNFKQFNDIHGHEVGDQVLKMVAGMIAQVQGGGQAFRYGGEEFALVFRGRSAQDAEPYLESLRQAIAAYRFLLRGPDRPERKPKRPPEIEGSGSANPASSASATIAHDGVTITISIGLAEHSNQYSTPELVLDAADAALYQAKEAGRNRVKRAAGASAQIASIQ